MFWYVVDCAYVHINTYETKKNKDDLCSEIQLCGKWIGDRSTNINRLKIQQKKFN